MTHALIGSRAARVLTDELARHPGPKTGLLIDVEPGSAVLDAAIDALLPDDTLTVVAADGSALRDDVEARGPWVAQRVRIVKDIGDATPADVVVVGSLLPADPTEVRAQLTGLRELVSPGGVLVVAAVAVPLLGKLVGLGGPGAPEAAGELDHLARAFGVGDDLVLLNLPPVRVHRLRFTDVTAAPAKAASSASESAEKAPAYRPSSVPLTRGMNIDSNGIAAAAICLGAAAVLKRAGRRRGIPSKLWLVPALAAAPVAAFFRDPERLVPDDPGAVVAASDGAVLSVEEIEDERFGEQTRWLRVAVFLSVLDVHVNRSPVAGRVVDMFAEKGGYAPAMNPAAEHNVAAYTVIDSPHGRVAVAQRTGLIARRIVRRVGIGADLAKGERFGLIRFGSRTDVYLPADAAEATVAPGDKVVGGSTVIARWK